MLSFGMGSALRRREEPDFSSSDDDDEECGNEQSVELTPENSLSCGLLEGDDCDLNLDLDAVGNRLAPFGTSKLARITLSSFSDIEADLDSCEKVSLVFLLSPNPQHCIYNITFREWAEKNLIPQLNWKERLLEGLSIIKNFKLSKKYGFCKDELVNEYFPFRYFTSKYVSKFRKVIYCLSETLSLQDEIDFLKILRSDFSKKGLIFSEYPQLEMYFTYFLKIGYITETNVKNCLQIFKIMGLENVCDMLTVIHTEDIRPSPTAKVVLDREMSADDTYNRLLEASTSGEYPSSLVESNCSMSTQDNTRHSYKNLKRSPGDSELINPAYDMKGNKICFIIDQENFHTEFRPEFQELRAENVDSEKLHSRSGTTLDSKRLKKVMEERNFQVEIERNLDHLRIIEELQKRVSAIDEKKCSCFVVVILSHGAEGVIYGCNSCQVEVSNIIELICHKKLTNIPKVLVIQACQGPTLQQRVVPDKTLEMDGPLIKARPNIKDPDFLIFWSTVAGFGSVRDKQAGTWFIQSLCNQLERAGNHEHFEEICTHVIREVMNEKWKRDKYTECYMVPLKDSTLSKKLYFKS